MYRLVWTKKVFDKDWWEVEVHIRISGRGKIGADGMAIWYTVEGAPGEGTDRRIYGSRDRWMGLGIVLDSFDNNNQQDNPVIMAFANDGTKVVFKSVRVIFSPEIENKR
jgi:mannose-binding lectin 1